MQFTPNYHARNIYDNSTHITTPWGLVLFNEKLERCEQKSGVFLVPIILIWRVGFRAQPCYKNKFTTLSQVSL
jgi:hypothetical protein